MICQMLNNVPGIRVMSEPWALLSALDQSRRGHFSGHQYEKLLVSLMKVQCKKEHSREVKQICIKLPFPCMSQVSLLRTLLPNIRHIYLFRQPLSAIASMMKVHKAYPPIYNWLKLGNEFWTFCYSLPPNIATGGFPEKIKKDTLTEAQLCSFVQLSSVRAAREFTKEGPFLGVFAYENLLNDKKEVDRFLDL